MTKLSENTTIYASFHLEERGERQPCALGVDQQQYNAYRTKRVLSLEMQKSYDSSLRLLWTFKKIFTTLINLTSDILNEKLSNPFTHLPKLVGTPIF